MEKNRVKNIVVVGLSMSFLVSFLIVLPVYILQFKMTYSIVLLWLSIFLQFFVLWTIDIALLHFIKKKWIESWLRIFVTMSFMTLIYMAIRQIIGDFYPIEDITLFQLLMSRFSFLLIFNILIFIILKLLSAKEKELNNIIEIAELKLANVESEYYLLKSQINPHFIFNALNTSKALIKSNPNAAESYIVKLSEFLRESIHYKKKSATLENEIKLCQNYLDLQKVRFGNVFVFNLDIENSHRQKHIPHFSMVMLVENAMKHNSFSQEEPLLISINIEDDWLIMRNRISPKNVVDSTSTGLENLNKRSKILAGEDIQVIQNEEEFKVKIKLIA